MEENNKDALHDKLDKIETHLANIYDLQKNKPVKKLFVKWLAFLYPALLVIMLFTLDLDHKKFIEIVGDIMELTADTQSFIYTDNPEN